MMGHEQPGESRTRRRFRRVSIAAALVVLVAFVIGDARPAFADPPGMPPQPIVTPSDGAIFVSIDTSQIVNASLIDTFTAECDSGDGGVTGTQVVGWSSSNPNPTLLITVSGLTNGSTYTCTVVAHNPDGNGPTSPASDPTMPNGRPAAPAQPTAVPLNASILVFFDAAFDGGSPITSYTASCLSSDGGVAGSGSGPTSPIDVLGLTNGPDYTCTVTATNANGDGLPSPPSGSVVPSTMPDTPAPPNAAAIGGGSISVTFTELKPFAETAPGMPYDEGSPILSYTVVCTSSDGGAPGFNSRAASPIVVGGLTNGSSYTCTVMAHNIQGDSGTSQPSNVVFPGAAPDAPATPTVAAGNASISVAFVAPPNNGSAILGYSAHCGSLEGAPNDAVGVTSPITVPGLTNGKTYTCTVKASNQFGTSPPSPLSGPAVPKTVPSRPGAPVVTAGNARLTVTFQAPVTGGFPITQYRVYCWSTNGGGTRTLFVKTLQVVVTGVINGKSYYCNITAYSVVGASLASVASKPVTPHSHGFRVFTGDGGVFTFGDSPYYGAARSASPVIAMMTTPDNHGYWLVAQNGAVYAFGNARSYGSLAGKPLNRPIVGGTATRTGRGYWLVASDGGIFAFGDAHFYGSTGSKHLVQPIVGMTATASGHGYWFVARDGGLFSFGDAQFYGSASGKLGPCNPSLGTCIVGMATSSGGTGYWIAAANGTVFGFGSAGLGRGRQSGLVYPITGIASTDTGRGYWITAANGAVFNMGDAPYIPWPRATRLNSYVRGISR
jgi:hypothetical protein